MKTYFFSFLLLLTMHCFAQESFHKFQWFGSIGQAIPLGAFSADKSSSNPMETGIGAPFGHSYRIGFDFYPVKYFGFTTGSAITDFKFDAETFRTMNHHDPEPGVYYIKNQDRQNRLMAGFTSRLIIGRFSIEPKLMFGIISPMYINAEYYQKSNVGDIYKITAYDYKSTYESAGFWGCLNGAVNINCNVFKMGEGPTLALFFFSEFTFMNPKIVQTTTISDSHTDLMSNTQTTFRQHFSFYYYGFGIMLKHGWFTHGAD